MRQGRHYCPVAGMRYCNRSMREHLAVRDMVSTTALSGT